MTPPRVSDERLANSIKTSRVPAAATFILDCIKDLREARAEIVRLKERYGHALTTLGCDEQSGCKAQLFDALKSERNALAEHLDIVTKKLGVERTHSEILAEQVRALRGFVEEVLKDSDRLALVEDGVRAGMEYGLPLSDSHLAEQSKLIAARVLAEKAKP